MAILTHAKFHLNRLMVTLIFGILASEPPPGPGERLKRPGLTGLMNGPSFSPYKPLQNDHFERSVICSFFSEIVLTY